MLFQVCYIFLREDFNFVVYFLVDEEDDEAETDEEEEDEEEKEQGESEEEVEYVEDFDESDVEEDMEDMGDEEELIRSLPLSKKRPLEIEYEPSVTINKNKERLKHRRQPPSSSNNA
jgi:hypothetical protein